MIPAVKAKLLEGKGGLVIGIANENSIAWGCAKAFRAFGAELAVTYRAECLESGSQRGASRAKAVIEYVGAKPPCGHSVRG